ncbi:hypothetical protein BUALT_Bualt01G0206600 [Buddleja alternifolia]|uniref:Cytochrome P450 n=1 Tax=Buddleja alternifolia TaxID=168488 RepID=A0AAV6YAC6_9LAMI|nr:hypothetical protein BUALT_Bualt01G0206600 [Buddleja alternifolia]
MARKSSKLPPGPFPFPIIGNILSLGSKPHISIAKLSEKYGPVMTLKLGSITTIVVSSPEAQKMVLQKHDSICSGRTVPGAGDALNHEQFSIVYQATNKQWRKLRKVSKEQMFSASRLDASEGLRKEKLQKMYDYVNECCERGRVIEIGEVAFTTSLNLISSTLFSKEFAQFGSSLSHEFKELVSAVTLCFGQPNYADFFPFLKPFDPQGILRQTKIYFKKLFAIFDEIIDDKLKNSASRIEKNDLVDALIEINQRDATELSRNDINHLLLAKYRWTFETIDDIKRVWWGIANRRYRDIICKERKKVELKVKSSKPLDWRGHGPKWLGENTWNKLCEDHWSTEKFQRMSDAGKNNRRSSADGTMSTHSGGSRPFAVHEEEMEDEYKRKVSKVELYDRTHRTKQGKGEFICDKAKRVRDAYDNLVEDNSLSTFNPDAWIEACGGVPKGRVYGFGSQPPHQILGDIAHSMRVVEELEILALQNLLKVLLLLLTTDK